MIYKPGFTLEDLDRFIQKMNQARPITQLPPTYVGEFGMLRFAIADIFPHPIHEISSWHLPKRARKILAEGRIGRKESGVRLLVYRSSWVSATGVVHFISPEPGYGLVTYAGKRFRYELYYGTKQLLQTNSLEEALNYQIEQS